MNLSGKWAGEYTFGEMFPETFRNKKVSLFWKSWMLTVI
jgi:hypothetical protein